MLTTEQNRNLTERVDECWHEFSGTPRPGCCKCNQQAWVNNDFNTWPGYGKLMAYLSHHNRVADLMVWLVEHDIGWLTWEKLGPDKRALAVLGFLQDEGVTEEYVRRMGYTPLEYQREQERKGNKVHFKEVNNNE